MSVARYRSFTLREDADIKSSKLTIGEFLLTPLFTFCLLSIRLQIYNESYSFHVLSMLEIDIF